LYFLSMLPLLPIIQLERLNTLAGIESEREKKLGVTTYMHEKNWNICESLQASLCACNCVYGFAQKQKKT
jgi:hypothetical protein